MPRRVSYEGCNRRQLDFNSIPCPCCLVVVAVRRPFFPVAFLFVSSICLTFPIIRDERAASFPSNSVPYDLEFLASRLDYVLLDARKRQRFII